MFVRDLLEESLTQKNDEIVTRPKLGAISIQLVQKYVYHIIMATVALALAFFVCYVGIFKDKARLVDATLVYIYKVVSSSRLVVVF